MRLSHAIGVLALTFIALGLFSYACTEVNKEARAQTTPSDGDLAADAARVQAEIAAKAVPKFEIVAEYSLTKVQLFGGLTETQAKEKWKYVQSAVESATLSSKHFAVILDDKDITANSIISLDNLSYITINSENTGDNR